MAYAVLSQCKHVETAAFVAVGVGQLTTLVCILPIAVPDRLAAAVKRWAAALFAKPAFVRCLARHCLGH